MSKWIWKKYEAIKKEDYAFKKGTGTSGVYASKTYNATIAKITNGQISTTSVSSFAGRLGQFVKKDSQTYVKISKIDETGYAYGDVYSLEKNTYYSQGSYIGEVTADYNTYTNNARNSDGYWYVRDREANTAPFFISPTTDKNLGNKNKGFTETFSVDDADLENSLKVVIRLNGTQIGQYLNATRKNSYQINISDLKLKECPLNQRSTINIELSDGTVTTNRNIYFTRTNSLPTISVANKNLGEQNESVSFSFTADDVDGDELTGKIYVDGALIKDLGEVTGGRKITESIKREDFISLSNGEHKIRIDITDSNGGVTSAYVSFTKKVTWYRYKLTHETEDMATDIRVDLLAELKGGVEINIKVCNNALDSSPTWEKIDPATWSKFTNKTKTGSAWAIGVDIEILKGRSVGISRIFGHNTSFA